MEKWSYEKLLIFLNKTIPEGNWSIDKIKLILTVKAKAISYGWKKSYHFIKFSEILIKNKVYV